MAFPRRPHLFYLAVVFTLNFLFTNVFTESLGQFPGGLHGGRGPQEKIAILAVFSIIFRLKNTYYCRSGPKVNQNGHNKTTLTFYVGV